MMDKICINCKARVFNPAVFKSLWRASGKQDVLKPVSEEVQFTMTALELESGEKSGCLFCPLLSGIVQKVVPVKVGPQYQQVPYDGATVCKVWLGLEFLDENIMAHSMHLETLPNPSFTGGSKDFVIFTPPGMMHFEELHIEH